MKKHIYAIGMASGYDSEGDIIEYVSTLEKAINTISSLTGRRVHDCTFIKEYLIYNDRLFIGSTANYKHGSADDDVYHISDYYVTMLELL